MKLILGLILFLVATIWSPTADAFSGSVSGQFLFYQHQGNYCPTTRDCTGARYLQSEYHTNVPVRDAKFYVALWSNWNNVIGTGNSDANGNINISWFSSTVQNPQVVIYTLTEHAGNRFSVRDINGNGYTTWGGPYNLSNGVASSVGAQVWGGAGNPFPHVNVYNGAWRMWTDALSYSGRMQSFFTNVVIKAFEPTVGAQCPTSCADGPNKTVRLDSNAAYQPQARIMHELGHVASYLSKTWKFAGDTYCYPSSSCGATAGSWAIDSAEWGNAAFEEGIAMFYGDVSLYWFNSGAPHTCASTSFCSNGVYNAENHTAATNCASNRGRYPLSVISYLRDLYDSTNETSTGVSSSCPGCFYTDDVSTGYHSFFDTQNSYVTGTGTYQGNEHWNSSQTAIDAVDGRGAASFWFNYRAFLGPDTWGELTLNCLPP